MHVKADPQRLGAEDLADWHLRFFSSLGILGNLLGGDWRPKLTNRVHLGQSHCCVVRTVWRTKIVILFVQLPMTPSTRIHIKPPPSSLRATALSGRIPANRVSGHQRKTRRHPIFPAQAVFSPNGFSSAAAPHFPFYYSPPPDFFVRVAISYSSTLPHDGLKFLSPWTPSLGTLN